MHHVGQPLHGKSDQPLLSPSGVCLLQVTAQSQALWLSPQEEEVQWRRVIPARSPPHLRVTYPTSSPLSRCPLTPPSWTIAHCVSKPLRVVIGPFDSIHRLGRPLDPSASCGKAQSRESLSMFLCMEVCLLHDPLATPGEHGT
jgi:hypothetical protein